MNRNLIYCLAFIFFTVSFSSCSKEYSVESGAFTKAKGSLHDNSGNCFTSTVFGNYYTGVKLTDSNYLQVQVNVTTPGNYTIASDVVNGFSFNDAGIFTTTGVQTIKLKATGTPLVNKNTNFLISFDSTFCNATVLVQDSTRNTGGVINTAADTAWQFTEGTKYFHGYIDTAFTHDTTVQTILYKSVQIIGLSALRGDSVFLLSITFPGGVITPGTYSSNTLSVFKFLGSFNDKDTVYSATYLTPTVNTIFQVTSYSSTTKIIKGTFSGTAKNKTNNSATITSGKFEAKLN
jgi:hypothetical protein